MPNFGAISRENKESKHKAKAQRTLHKEITQKQLPSELTSKAAALQERAQTVLFYYCLSLTVWIFFSFPICRSYVCAFTNLFPQPWL